jgi:lysozyme
MFGIDVSHHQGTINFNKLIDNDPKIDFIFFKSSQGVGFKDSTTKQNSFEAQRIGLTVGYYHYATLPTKDVTIDATA